MSHAKRQPLWKQSFTLGPGAAALLGVALGCALALLCAFTPPRDFTYRFLAILLLIIGTCGGVFGYALWLEGDKERSDRFQRVTSRVAGYAIAGLLVAFPSFWWELGRSMGPLMVVILMGGVCAASMFAVGAWWGMVHLFHHLTSVPWYAKPGIDSRTDGVWDRELDQGQAVEG